MQFNININQKAFTKVAPDCDIVDAAIFDFIHNFIGSGKTDRIEDNGDWYWVSYQKIIDENPILGITTKAPIYKRIDKLVEADILVRYKKNQEIGKTYFGRGMNYQNILYNDPRSNEIDPTSEKIDPSVLKDRPPTSEKIDNHSTNNHNTNHKSARVCNCPIPKPLQVKGFKKRFQEYEAYLLEEKKQHMSIQRVQSYFRKLIELKQKGNDPLKVIDQTMQGGHGKFYALNDFDDDNSDKNLFDQRAIMRKKRREHASRN